MPRPDLGPPDENGFGADIRREGGSWPRSPPSPSGPVPLPVVAFRAWGTRRAAPVRSGSGYCWRCSPCAPAAAAPRRTGVSQSRACGRSRAWGVVERPGMAALLRRAGPCALRLDAEDGHGLPELAARALRAVVAPHANPPDLVGRQPPGGGQDGLHGARRPGRGEKTQECHLRPSTPATLRRQWPAARLGELLAALEHAAGQGRHAASAAPRLLWPTSGVVSLYSHAGAICHTSSGRLRQRRRGGGAFNVPGSPVARAIAPCGGGAGAAPGRPVRADEWQARLGT